MSAALAASLPGSKRIRVYVWELPVRIAHWLIFFSIMVLAATGFYIGHPFISVSGMARDHFVMGTVKVVHFYAAIVFTLAVLSRLWWMLMGNRYARWSQFIPVSAARWRDLRETAKFYVFARRDPPPTVGHSALAGAFYAVIYGICLVMIGTGLAMYSPMAPLGSPMRWFSFLIPIFGGLPTARLIHHIGMWLLLAFMVHHVYSAILYSAVQRTGTVESMVSGNKFVEPEALAEEGDD